MAWSDKARQAARLARSRTPKDAGITARVNKRDVTMRGFLRYDTSLVKYRSTLGGGKAVRGTPERKSLAAVMRAGRAAGKAVVDQTPSVFMRKDARITTGRSQAHKVGRQHLLKMFSS